MNEGPYRIGLSISTLSPLNIHFNDNNCINIFPTDLHGAVGNKFYVGSLRKDGLANRQVEKFRKIVVSEISTKGYKQAYVMGKNHMKELRISDEFQILEQRSRTFGFVIPLWTTKYRELILLSSLDIGIHRVHIYEILNECALNSNDSMLVHIHQYYAQWRKDNGLTDRLLMR